MGGYNGTIVFTIHSIGFIILLMNDIKYCNHSRQLPREQHHVCLRRRSCYTFLIFLSLQFEFLN